MLSSDLAKMAESNRHRWRVVARSAWAMQRTINFMGVLNDDDDEQDEDDPSAKRHGGGSGDEAAR